MQNEIRDPSLAPEGIRRIEWAGRYMPVLNSIRERFRREQPLKGVNMAVSVHLEAKTANLALALREAGANVAVTGCNPLSTQDAVAAACDALGLRVNAWWGATQEEYVRHLKRTLDIEPQIIIDDGGDLVGLLHGEYSHLIPGIWGGCEETTTGVRRLHAMQAQGVLRFPMIAVNDAACKHLFDNRHGTGQSVWDGIMRTTNLIVAGRRVVVAGYGWCGRGVAERARGLGAEVIVTEVDPVCAMEALMEGFQVMPMEQAAPLGDFFITVTGCRDVIRREHFELMKDGAILCNAGHFDVEVDRRALEAMAQEVTQPRFNVEGFKMADGRTLMLLAEGRLVNLAAGDGHPAEIMDMSFAVQALCSEYMAKNHAGLTPGVYDAPKDIDDWIAWEKLKTLGVAIDALSDAQKEYLASGGGE